MKDFSIDLETFGTDTDAFIVSIGIVQFDAMSGKIGEAFQWRMPTRKEQRGRSVSPDTITWWLQQSDAARESLLDSGGNKHTLLEALKEIHEWMGPTTDSNKVWGNGATFDISIMESAFRTEGAPSRIPWKFWNIRDMRTVVDMAWRLKKFDHRKFERQGTHHSALDDAMHQAKVIAKCYDLLK